MTEAGHIASALAAAQAEMGHAVFDNVNPHFKSKFASLKSVIDATKKALTDNGIACVQMPFESDNGLGIETVLLHESGERISSRIVVPVDKPTAQGMGSAITYARRYALAAICGIAADDDDDGNATTKETESAMKERQEALERLKSKTEPLVVALQIEDYGAAHEIWSEFDADQKQFLYNKTPRSGGVFTHEQKSQLRQMDRRYAETGDPSEQTESTEQGADNGAGAEERPEGQEA